MSDKRLLGGRLVVVSGDITGIAADGIVNAANSSLMGGGGVDGAIHRKGGSAILAECKRIRESAYPGGLPTGEAVSTSGGNLPCSYVIHTVGPVWHGGNKKEPDLLANCYRRSLEVAKELQIESVAFPAISTGIYGYPKDQAARIAFEEIRKFIVREELPKIVYFVYFSQNDKDVFLQNVS